jgi:hypothetical protein
LCVLDTRSADRSITTSPVCLFYLSSAVDSREDVGTRQKEKM